MGLAYVNPEQVIRCDAGVYDERRISQPVCLALYCLVLQLIVDPVKYLVQLKGAVMQQGEVSRTAS
jgi:hypothetical protein